MSEGRRHLGVGAAFSVFVQGGPLLAAAVMSIVLARTIGPSANGRFALVATLAGLVGMVVSLGLSAGITYEVSRRRWSVRQAFGASYAIALVLGLAGFGIGLAAFALTDDSVFESVRLELVALALATLAPALAYQYASSILLAREHYEGYAGLQLSHSAALALAGAALALAFGVTGAVIGLLIAACFGAVLGALLLVREARRDSVTDRGRSLGRALRFGLQAWGANLMQQINYRFDVLILGAFAGVRDVGVYSVALTLTGTAWVLPQALQTVLFPRVAGLAEATLTGEVTAEESDAALAKAMRHGVLLMLPAALLIGLLLLVAVPLLYGGQFRDSTWLGFVLLPGTLMLGLAKIMSSATTGRGFPRYALYVGAISVPSTLALYFTLIPAFEASGAAIASSLSYALTALVTLVFFRRVTALELRTAFVPRGQDLADYGGLARLAAAWRPRR